METLLAYAVQIEPWHWWALAAILIGLEIMSTTFYLLWPGVAAAIVGLLLLLMPDLSVTAQWLLFSVLAVVSTVIWKRFAPASFANNEPHPTLNRRSANYIGRRAKAAVDFSGGRGAIFLDDTRWSAVSADGSDPRKGEPLEIVAADGAVLTVERTN